MTETVLIRTFSDIPGFLRRIECICKALSFSTFETANLKLAASEVSTNIIKYAKDGEARIHSDPNDLSVRIRFCDSGPGIRFIDLALLDGYTTFSGPSLGLGLGAAKRSVDCISIKNEPDGGLTVEITKRARKLIT